MEINPHLRSIRACPEGLIWMHQQGDPELAEAWRICTRGDWMAWYAGKMTKTDARTFIAALQECIDLAPGCHKLEPYSDLGMVGVWAIQAVASSLPVPKEETLAKCADIFRKHYPYLP